MHTLKPLDTEAVLAAARETGGIVTVEEHSVASGLGVAVADVLASSGLRHGPFRKIGVPDALNHVIGSQDHLRALCGDIVQTALGAVRAGASSPGPESAG
jgi:transketolase